MSNNKKLTVQKLTEQFQKECIVLDAEKEYPGYVGKEKVIIATDLTEEELESKYAAFVGSLKPYILVKMAFLDVRRDYRRNAKKHRRRAERTECINGYVEGETEVSDKMISCEMVYDSLEKECRDSIIQTAINRLTEVQKRRIHMRYFEGLSYKEIAEKEGVEIGTISKSIKLALEKLVSDKKLKRYYSEQ